MSSLVLSLLGGGAESLLLLVGFVFGGDWEGGSCCVVDCVLVDCWVVCGGSLCMLLLVVGWGS